MAEQDKTPKIIAVHNCVTVPRLLMLSQHLTISGNVMFYVTTIKPDGAVHMRRPFNQEEHAQDFYRMEVKLDG